VAIAVAFLIAGLDCRLRSLLSSLSQTIPNPDRDRRRRRFPLSAFRISGFIFRFPVSGSGPGRGPETWIED
jgi:hypothetical protein